MNSPSLPARGGRCQLGLGGAEGVGWSGENPRQGAGKAGPWGPQNSLPSGRGWLSACPQGRGTWRAEKGSSTQTVCIPEARRKLPGHVWEQACEDRATGWWSSGGSRWLSEAEGGSGGKVTPF